MSAAPLRDAAAILERCTQHGFALAGVCTAAPSAHAAEYRAWVAAGQHGQMEYLAQDIAARLDPGHLVPGARSVLCVADRYAAGRPDARTPGRGRIARYARGEDYHGVIRQRLEALAGELRAAHPGHVFRVCVDTAPVMEREHAARAGVGRIGKHTLLIGAEGQGSWLVLGVVVTTLALAPSAVAHAAPPGGTDPCGTCTRCIDACPTRAIQPWSVDARRCISYLTIEHRGDIEPGLAAGVGDWLFGCDVCQEVCPHNQPTRRAGARPVHPAYEPYHRSFDLLTVLGWTDADWQAARLHGALRRADRAMWVRNAANAAGCALRGADEPLGLDGECAAALRGALERLATSPGEAGEVRNAARGALHLFGSSGAGDGSSSGAS